MHSYIVVEPSNDGNQLSIAAFDPMKGSLAFFRMLPRGVHNTDRLHSRAVNIKSLAGGPYTGSRKPERSKASPAFLFFLFKEPQMSTEAQVAANRANSQHSTGPKSAEGKAVICLNAFRHGLAGAFIILPDEIREDFNELHEGLRAEA